MGVDSPLPAKPLMGQPCNGCGICCAAEVCALGKMALGDDAPAPCSLLRRRDGRVWCGLVLMEAQAGLEPLAARALGIGKGCDAEVVDA